MSTLSQKIDFIINKASQLHVCGDARRVPTEDLVNMLNSMPPQLWRDASLQFIDCQSGLGVLGLLLLQRLHEGLRDAMPDDQERLNHILGSMLKLGDEREDMRLITKASFTRVVQAVGLKGGGVNVTSGAARLKEAETQAGQGHTVVGTSNPEKSGITLIVLAPPGWGV